MHVAYCDENPKNAESFPCVMHRLQATSSTSPNLNLNPIPNRNRNPLHIS